ncbi:hypothetical protein LOTGIDRAFT_167796 [Lottia gigantea]|uniref:Uncharacterized protein n=1 Tax=Lottia gigantea TaxID=225164 RepID=V3ZNA8_LOTGI|nr:hypothetical protein LOTGIDRAFT_167796 [Lottia gigantea]ESO85817.1 hypothetical protein LOTGIDRAFT_167796 [Lottia gigantea]
MSKSPVSNCPVSNCPVTNSSYFRKLATAAVTFNCQLFLTSARNNEPTKIYYEKWTSNMQSYSALELGRSSLQSSSTSKHSSTVSSTIGTSLSSTTNPKHSSSHHQSHDTLSQFAEIKTEKLSFEESMNLPDQSTK